MASGARFEQTAKLGFRAASFGQVTNRTTDQEAVRSLQRTQAYLDGKLISVFLEAVQVQPFSHAACPRLGKVVVPMARMLGAEPLRHEHFDWLAEQFLAWIAEEFLCLGIYQHDGSRLIDDDHRIGG
jgi:hypothetical protein